MTRWEDVFQALRAFGLTPEERRAGKRALEAHMEAVRPEPQERFIPDMAAPPSAGTHLTPQELAAGRAALRRFIAAHPVRAAWSPLRFLWSPALAGVVLLTGVAGAGAAHGSMPGDALYGLKVAVVEPLMTLGYVGEEARVLRAAALAERRKEEADLLAARSEEADEEAWVAMEQAIDRTATLLSSLPPEAAATVRGRLQVATNAGLTQALATPAGERAAGLLRRLAGPDIAVHSYAAEDTAASARIAPALPQAPAPAADDAVTLTAPAPEAANAPEPLAVPADAPPANARRKTQEQPALMQQMMLKGMPAPEAVILPEACPPEDAEAASSAASCSGSGSSLSSAGAFSGSMLRAPSPAPAEGLPGARQSPGL